MDERYGVYGYRNVKMAGEVVAVTGMNPVTSIGLGCADPSAGYRHLST
jgi:hypothetical protein